jgi:hypothetical protein
MRRGTSMTASDDWAQLDTLAKSRDYGAYVFRYRAILNELPAAARPHHFNSIAYALIALGTYADALSCAQQYHETAHLAPKGGRDLARGLDIVGACLWMLGRRSEALETWKGLCAGILAGKYKYTSDVAGGLDYGLLYWYAAVSEQNSVEKNRATDYLRDRVGRVTTLDATEVWPVAAARCALGELSTQQMIDSANARPSWLHVRQEAETETQELNRRMRLCTAYFVAGTAERQQGNEVRNFDNASELKNPFRSLPWYLSRHESDLRRIVPDKGGVGN